MPRKLEPFGGALHPHLRWWRLQTGLPEVSARQVRHARAAYWGLVAEVDRMIGQILSAVRENDLEQDLLIVYTSDHGDMLGEHGLWWKHTFYEESARVPLIVAWPGVIPAHQRCRRVVSAVDVTATVLEALGSPPLPNAFGKSFLHLLVGQDSPWDDLAFSEYCSDTYCPEGGCYQRMIRQDAWKLVYYHGLEPQLFNLSEDPDEMVDRADDSACRAIRTELEAKVLEGWNPDEIAAKMAAKRADNELLHAWGQQTHPLEHYRWPLEPDMNYLD
jgi:choline-sulfatase